MVPDISNLATMVPLLTFIRLLKEEIYDAMIWFNIEIWRLQKYAFIEWNTLQNYFWQC